MHALTVPPGLGRALAIALVVLAPFATAMKCIRAQLDAAPPAPEMRVPISHMSMR
jgi:hypothetical protein